MAARSAGKQLSLWAMTPFAAPAIGLNALGVAVFVYLPPYFASHLAVPMVTIGLVWGLVRLLDVPVDVLLAIAMDRTRTRLGRYRVWLVGGSPILMLALYYLFMAPRGFSAAYLFIWLAVMYLGNSIVSLAHQAWAATLIGDYHGRSRLFGVLNAVGLMGVAATMAVLIAAPMRGLSDASAVQACGWLIIALIPVGAALAVATTGETIEPLASTRAVAVRDYWQVLVKPDLLRLFTSQIAVTLGPGWMSAIYLFFFKASRGFTTQQATILLGIYILAGIPGAMLTAVVARRIGKHRTLIASTTAYSLGLASIFVLPKASMAAFAPMMFVEGLLASAFGMLVQAMLADVGDEIRLIQGHQRMSLVYAVNTLAQKIAAAGAIALTFPLLQGLGFNPGEGAVNTARAIHNLDLAFLIGPIAFVMLGGACVFGWRLDAARHAAVQGALAARDASGDQPEAVAEAVPLERRLPA